MIGRCDLRLSLHLPLLLVLADALRPEAGATVARLGHLGLRTVLVSGDNRATAERVAAELGIGEVHADVERIDSYGRGVRS